MINVLMKLFMSKSRLFDMMTYRVYSDQDISSVIQRVQDACQKHNFALLHDYVYHEILESKGFAIKRKVYIYEVCQASVAATVLTHEPNVAPFMPCRIAIYEEDKKVVISTQNMQMMLNTFKGNAQLYRETTEVFKTLQSVDAQNDEQELSKKVVFDLTTGNLKTFEQRILSGVARYTAAYEGNLQEFKAVVVIHGDAYKFFVKDLAHSPFKEQHELVEVNSELKKRITSAKEIYGVEFLMCEANMKKAKLSQKDIYPFVKLVPSSTMGLIEKQNEGYAYIPVR